MRKSIFYTPLTAILCLRVFLWYPYLSHLKRCEQAEVNTMWAWELKWWWAQRMKIQFRTINLLAMPFRSRTAATLRTRFSFLLQFSSPMLLEALNFMFYFCESKIEQIESGKVLWKGRKKISMVEKFELELDLNPRI